MNQEDTIKTATSTARAIQLSVVVLAYRSNEQIREFVSEITADFDNAGIENYELVLVANYDAESEVKDLTPEIVTGMAALDEKIVPVTLEKKGRMGWDARQGMQVARGEVIALIDGDGQMPPDDLVRLFHLMNTGALEFVKTYRIERHDGRIRLVVSRVFNLLYRLLFPSCKFRDVNSKPKLVKKTAFDRMELNNNGWFFDGEMVLEAVRLGLSFAEIPTSFKANEWRGSFVGVDAVFEMLGSMISYRLRRRLSS